MNRVKLFLVGYGKHAEHILVPALSRLPVEIVGIADTDPRRLQAYFDLYKKIPAFDSAEQLFAGGKADAVVCAVGPDVHHRVACAALRHGMDVFIEKSPCLGAAQARELAELERTTGRFVMTGFNRRWTTAYRLAAEAASRFPDRPPMMYYARYHASDYGNLARFVDNHLVHHMDLVRFFVGEIADFSVSSFRLTEGKVGLNISFTSESGCLGTIQSASLLSDSYPQESVEFLGDGWEMIVDNHQEVKYNRDTRRAAKRLHPDPVRLDDGLDTLIWNQNRTMFPPSLHQDTGFAIELEHFVASCAARSWPLSHADDMLKTMELMDRLREKVGLH